MLKHLKLFKRCEEMNKLLTFQEILEFVTMENEAINWHFIIYVIIDAFYALQSCITTYNLIYFKQISEFFIVKFEGKIYI